MQEFKVCIDNFEFLYYKDKVKSTYVFFEHTLDGVADFGPLSRNQDVQSLHDDLYKLGIFPN